MAENIKDQIVEDADEEMTEIELALPAEDWERLNAEATAKGMDLNDYINERLIESFEREKAAKQMISDVDEIISKHPDMDHTAMEALNAVKTVMNALLDFWNGKISEEELSAIMIEYNKGRSSLDNTSHNID